MSESENNPMAVKPTDPIDSTSTFAFLFYALGGLLALIAVVILFALFSGGGGSEIITALIGSLVACFNCFLAGHIIQILANIRWFTYKTSERLSSESFDPSLFSGVIDELKKISEQNKEQSEALKKSIEELSEKAEKTNTYLYHIYKK
jgi:hypothetical protein